MVATNEVEKPQQEKEPTQSHRPGVEREMRDAPVFLKPGYRGAEKLKGRAALITGGDSGIGRAVAVAFALEGADVALVYLSEKEDADAQETARHVKKAGRRCLLLRGDVGDPAFAHEAIDRVKQEFGRLDVLVNNAAEQHPQESIEDVSPEQVERTFRTNIFGYFNMTRAAMKLLEAQDGSTIINTTSVTAFRGSGKLLDYSATKGAILAFTRSLSESLAEKNIRVNAVAPGPIWTPLITSTFPKEKVASFGKDVALKRPGQPYEVAGAYVFLASDDSTYVTGQTIHVNGGEIVNA